VFTTDNLSLRHRLGHDYNEEISHGLGLQKPFEHPLNAYAHSYT